MLIFDNQLKGLLKLKRDRHNSILIPIRIEKTIEIIEDEIEIIFEEEELKSVVGNCVIC